MYCEAKASVWDRGCLRHHFPLFEECLSSPDVPPWGLCCFLLPVPTPLWTLTLKSISSGSEVFAPPLESGLVRWLALSCTVWPNRLCASSHFRLKRACTLHTLGSLSPARWKSQAIPWEEEWPHTGDTECARWVHRRPTSSLSSCQRYMSPVSFADPHDH